MFDKKKRRE